MEKEETKFSLRCGASKPFKTFDEQLDLLISRGLIVEDRENAISILKRTNYYRLSAYSLSLRNDNVFETGTTFQNIYDLYLFDNGFREIILNYSSHIEIAFRTYIAYELAEKYGPLGYLDYRNFDNQSYHESFIQILTDSIDKADDIFVEHHKNDYAGVFPIWVAIECTTFGNLSKLYKNLLKADREDIDKKYAGVGYKKLANWLNVCVYARNIAAHGGRFYNRRLRRVRPSLNPYAKRHISADTAFAVVYVISRLLPTKDLVVGLIAELKTLFHEYPFALGQYLGFPDEWEEVLLKKYVSDTAQGLD